jgi:hypothetical protein
MARIVVQALHSDGEPRRWTLSERIVTENLDSDHYATQLIERLSWATAEAEALESRSADLAAHDDGERRYRQPPIQSALITAGIEGRGNRDSRVIPDARSAPTWDGPAL